MYKHTSLSVAAIIATLTLGLPALAAETSPAGPVAPAPEHRAAPKKVATQPVAPRPAAAEDPYRCNQADVSCTVVRETAQGTLIVTVRPTGQSAIIPAWLVISGAPPSPGPHPGGKVYVVPSSAEPEPTAHQAALTYVNGAPILD
jgi:hypothetical protein